MKRVAVIAVPLMLGGCGGPIELTMLSLAGDAISYIASGKSTTDHAISAIADKDCALLRTLSGDPVCRAYEEEPVFAAVDEGSTVPSPALAEDIAVSEFKLVEVAEVQEAIMLPVPRAKPVPQQMEAVAASVHEDDIFLVLGSGTDSFSMAEMKTRHADLGARLVSSDFGGEPYYRLITGPYALGELDDARQQLAAAGISQSWAMRADAGGW